jgi:DNA-binding HxlR family transcriptional regulator
MSIRYGQFCPIAKAAELLGERWTILIVRELLIGTTRFNDFQRALSQISPTLLTRRLNELRECGLVVRKTLPGQRRTEYQLTAAGRELEPVIKDLGVWGMKWARGQMSDDELDVELLMVDLHRRIDTAQLPGGRTVIHFHFPGLPKFAHWWIIFPGDGSRELCAHNPGKTVDLHLTTEVRTMTEIWAGDIELRHAKESGRLQFKGDATLIRTVASWLRPGLFSKVRPAG